MDDGSSLELIVYLLYGVILCEDMVGIFYKRKTKRREDQKQVADRIDLQGPRVPAPAPEMRLCFTL